MIWVSVTPESASALVQLPLAAEFSNPLPTAVVEGLLGASKRANTSLDEVLGGLGLSAEQGTAAQPARQRFRRVTTLSGAQLSTMDTSKLQCMLKDAPKPALQAGQEGAAATPGMTPPQPVVGAASYEQIRHRRGLNNFERTEAVADPLRAVTGQVYDVVRRAESEADAAGRRARERELARQAAAQYEEGTLLCNYMPMVREYLHTQGDSAAGDGTEASGQGVEDMDAEYVYDLYVAEVGAAQGEEGEDEAAAWWQLHSAGATPVVRILADDTWLVLEASDAEDSDADSDDSNAEGFYANDYPDESDDYTSSDDEEDGSRGASSDD